MKALTLTQPYATLVAQGQKRFETRSWRTDYRGPLAIHAAKTFPLAARAVCYREDFATTLTDSGKPRLAAIDEAARTLPLGVIVAAANLTVCHRVEDVRNSLGGKHDGRLERAFGDYSDGRYAFRLDDVVQLPQPIEAKGALGLWDVPPDLVDELALQVARGHDVAAGLPACEECGCTENGACEGGCSWVKPRLCSSCVAVLA